MKTESDLNNGDEPAKVSSQTQSMEKIDKNLSMSEEGEEEGFSLSLTSSRSSTSSGSPFDDYDPLSDLAPGPEAQSTQELSTQTPGWSMISGASPPRHNGVGELSPMRSPPPTQTMGQFGPYDPSRIPASVFSSKPSTPMDWSTASNDSLFSIHMGNNSFSRDSAFMMGKTEDFTRPEERHLPPLNKVSVDKEVKKEEAPTIVQEEPPKNLKQVPEENTKLKTITEENSEKRGSKVYPIEEAHTPSPRSNISSPSHSRSNISSPSPRSKDDNGFPPNKTIHSPSSSPTRLSNDSVMSNRSFAFPVLLNEVPDAKSGKSLKALSAKQDEPEVQPTIPNEPSKQTSWFSWLVCWPKCC